MRKPDIHPALRAARHFVLVASGRINGTHSRSALHRDVQVLMDALWQLGVRPSAEDDPAPRH